MSSRSDKIEFDLLANAIDSIDQAIYLLAWEEGITSEAQKLKNAVRNIAHAVELLLKERLGRVHQSLVWENVDKYPNLSSRTVGVDQVINRLERIGNVKLSSSDVELVKSLRNTRNAIEHYAWTTTRKEAESIVGAGLSFAVSFAKEFLDLDIVGYKHRRDDTWQQLIEKSYSFTQAHSKRFEARAVELNQIYNLCDFCGSLAVKPEGGACEICGHWNDDAGDDLLL